MHEEHRDLIDALGSTRELDDLAWARVRERLAGRAEAEGLVDVAVARHDSPLGTLLLGATREGLVRVGLPGEDEDEVLDELARRLCPRILGAPRDAVARARTQLDEYFRRAERQVRLLAREAEAVRENRPGSSSDLTSEIARNIVALQRAARRFGFEVCGVV